MNRRTSIKSALAALLGFLAWPFASKVDGVPRVFQSTPNEVQNVFTSGSVTGGTFTIHHNNRSAILNWDATDEQWQEAFDHIYP